MSVKHYGRQTGFDSFEELWSVDCDGCDFQLDDMESETHSWDDVDARLQRLDVLSIGEQHFCRTCQQAVRWLAWLSASEGRV